MPKYRHFFPRSEYEIAVHNYRRARRRGDVADAQRWIKLAQMHLRLAHLMEDGAYTRRKREDEEIARTEPIEKQKRDQADCYATRQAIDALEARALAEVRAAWLAEQRAKASSNRQ